MSLGDVAEPKPGSGSGEHNPLWQELAMVVTTADPVPPEVPLTGRYSFTWRTIDAELAELAYDSVVGRAAGVRGSEDQRLLTFEAPRLTLELQVSALGARRRLIGQLVPPQRARVMVRHQEGIVAVEADELGRFRVEDLPAGPGSLRCHLAGEEGGAPVVTDWVTL
jgi:hypothetical protein